MIEKNMLLIQNKIQQKSLSTKTPNVLHKKSTNTGKKFSDYLTENLDDQVLKFSKHATDRLRSRSISLSNSQLTRINKGIMEAEKKGVKDSLVLVDDVTLVVSVPNKTVVTAVNKNEQQIFTNIDGAIII